MPFGLNQFQSTLPAREATFTEIAIPHGLGFQSTLPAREATIVIFIHFGNINISIHASREGSDRGDPSQQADILQFQSTLPAREATRKAAETLDVIQFQSTLPAREATSGVCSGDADDMHFNPRFPRGKRLRFQPTGLL